MRVDRDRPHACADMVAAVEDPRGSLDHFPSFSRVVREAIVGLWYHAASERSKAKPLPPLKTSD